MRAQRQMSARVESARARRVRLVSHDSDEPVSRDEAAILMRNLRRTRPMIVALFGAISAVMHFVGHISVIPVVAFSSS